MRRPWRNRIPFTGSRELLSTLLCLTLAFIIAPPGLGQDDPATGDADETSAAPYEVEETLTVTDTRLPDEPADALRLPANVTVLTRQAIESAGVGTLQDLLAYEAGAVVYDQVGNDVGKTFDLRGFTGGSGTRVFLDGVPLNQPRNNSLSLELVPPSALERVEIVRGSASALAGGGAEAGVINLQTRSVEEAGGYVAVGAGEWSSLDTRLDAWGSLGATDVMVSGTWFETDGFRDNAGGDLGRLAGNLSWRLGEGRLRLSGLAAESDFGTPGALTPDELADDPAQAPFNQLDFADSGLGLLSLAFQGPVAEAFSLAANLWTQDLDTEILSTGRAAPAFGGFFLDSGVDSLGGAAQLDYRYGGGDQKLTFGLEWLDGDTDARGFPTPPADPGAVDRSAPSSDNTAGRETLALYTQGNWQLASRWSLLAGARWDEDDTSYTERVPDPTLRGQRTDSELSLRGGLSYAATADWSVYLSYGEAFLPPTVEQLYSFPGFGSNPDLEPEDSRSLELGVRHTWGNLTFDAALFQIDTDNEVVFDPDSPLGLFGANVNAGETRRRGLEASLRGAVSPELTLFANLTLIDAEFESGDNAGNTVPLVPGERLGAGVDVALPASFVLRLDGLWVGEQVLDNDDANAQQELEDYQVVNLRLTWEARSIAPGLALYVQARNLFDEEYATRGIYAFDFSTFQNEVFLTPAPGRWVSGGIEWGF